MGRSCTVGDGHHSEKKVLNGDPKGEDKEGYPRKILVENDVEEDRHFLESDSGAY